jgi:hypothetical protein
MQATASRQVHPLSHPPVCTKWQTHAAIPSAWVQHVQHIQQQQQQQQPTFSVMKSKMFCVEPTVPMFLRRAAMAKLNISPGTSKCAVR